MNERLYMPAYLSKVLDRSGFSFSKALGQNFLIDGNIVRRIVDSAEICCDDVVFEIGPGVGTLTEELALRAKRVVSIELDKRLIPILENTLAKHDNVVIIEADAMKVDFKELIEEYCPNKMPKLVANLPYNVGTPLVAGLLERQTGIESYTVMVQNEVADRMVAEPGTKDYGSLSLLVRYYSDPVKLFKVPKSVFVPKPKIDSAVIKLSTKRNPEQVDRHLLFSIIRSGFNQRRKTILNSFTSNDNGISKEMLNDILDELKISPKLRAENLSLEDYIRIANRMEILMKDVESI